MFASLLSVLKSCLRPAKRAYINIKLRPTNKRIFNSIIDLSSYRLSYYSVLLDRTILEDEVIKQVLDGDIVICENLVECLNLSEQIESLCRQYYGIGYSDLSEIHKKRSVEEIIDSSIKAKNSALCLKIQSSIMSRLLAPHSKRFFLELHPNLRLHLPYQYIIDKIAYIEKRMGRGKLNPHGQHKDSWRFHPENTLNVWLSLTDSTNKNGLAILPKSANYMPKYDVNQQEISPSVKTYPSQQFVTNIKKGTALFFKAELLHGSIINTTEKTRVAFSMRCTIDEPKFHRTFQHNYIKVDNNRFGNLTIAKILGRHKFITPSRDSHFEPCESLDTHLRVTSFDEKRINIEIKGELKNFPRYCPHAGTDLLFGELDKNGNLLCPSHRMCIKSLACKE